MHSKMSLSVQSFKDIKLPLCLLLLISILSTHSISGIQDGSKPLEQTLDIAIVNGTIVDGTGSRRFKADVGIIKDMIVYVKSGRKIKAKTVIDASGLLVTPGFIDIHTHAEDSILDIPTADNYLLQGVTTIIAGNCGASYFPLSDLFEKITRRGSALNFGSYVGHNTVRALYMGTKRGKPDAREMKLLKQAIAQEMRSGALGLSTGLVYRPGRSAGTEELIELARVAADYQGIYASHIRGEGTGIRVAIEEAIRVGEEGDIPVQISHIKLYGQDAWGHIEDIRAPIETARQKGIRVTTDQYPYTAAFTSFSTWFPSGIRRVLRRPHRYPKQYIGLRRNLERMFLESMENTRIASFPPDRRYDGKNFTEILQMLGRRVTPRNAAELLIDIHRRGNATGIFFQMSEEDVRQLMKLEYNMIASDGYIEQMNTGSPHCRSYGTFPRIFSRYVREDQNLTMEDAVRKMTSLPADTLGLYDRGRIQIGAKADIVVFDSDTIRDKSTFQNPHQYPEGLAWVIVNGVAAAQNGVPTGLLNGQLVLGPGKE